MEASSLDGLRHFHIADKSMPVSPSGPVVTSVETKRSQRQEKENTQNDSRSVCECRGEGGFLERSVPVAPACRAF